MQPRALRTTVLYRESYIDISLTQTHEVGKHRGTQAEGCTSICWHREHLVHTTMCHCAWACTLPCVSLQCLCHVLVSGDTNLCLQPLVQGDCPQNWSCSSAGLSQWNKFPYCCNKTTTSYLEHNKSNNTIANACTQHSDQYYCVKFSSSVPWGRSNFQFPLQYRYCWQDTANQPVAAALYSNIQLRCSKHEPKACSGCLLAICVSTAVCGFPSPSGFLMKYGKDHTRATFKIYSDTWHVPHLFPFYCLRHFGAL